MQYADCKSTPVEAIIIKKSEIEAKNSTQAMLSINQMKLKNLKCYLLQPYEFINADLTPVKFCFDVFTMIGIGKKLYYFSPNSLA